MGLDALHWLGWHGRRGGRHPLWLEIEGTLMSWLRLIAWEILVLGVFSWDVSKRSGPDSTFNLSPVSERSEPTGAFPPPNTHAPHGAGGPAAKRTATGCSADMGPGRNDVPGSPR